MSHGTEEPVERHYGRGGVLDAILRALRAIGKDLDRLAPADLAPIDEFHIRGREATIELAGRASLTPGLRVLDVGSGLGGSARYLASERGARVSGIDLTKEYVETATALAKLVKLDDQVEFRQASALELPFADASFDVVWTEHVQMNIGDKRRFYGEIARVLVPGGRVLLHDVFQGPGGEPHFPTPWAEQPAISFLATPEAVREILAAVGFEVLDWEDKSQPSLDWFMAAIEKAQTAAPQPLGLHLLMGPTARVKFQNLVRNLREHRVLVVQAVARKT